jgi:hypothetical protein
MLVDCIFFCRRSGWFVGFIKRAQWPRRHQRHQLTQPLSLVTLIRGAWASLYPCNFPWVPENLPHTPNMLHPIIDPFVSFYSTTGNNRTISPAILPMTGMGSYGVQMDTTHFRDPRANVWSILYQRIGIGPSRDGGFMDGLDSGAMPVVLRDPRMRPPTNRWWYMEIVG